MDARAHGRRGSSGALVAVLVWALAAAPLFASDLQTVNSTDAYVDPSVAVDFITVPTLCDEPLGSAGTSATACGELGTRALLAIQGASPYGDMYWEPQGSILQATNAFVPGNEGSNVGDTGYAPLFSDHKYDLFGRADEFMGVLSRREILLMDSIATTGGGITVGQTTPGTDTMEALIARILAVPEGATSFSAGGHTFVIADLPAYARVTGFTGGKRTTVQTYCSTTYGFGSCSNPEFAAMIYIEDHFPEIVDNGCASRADSAHFPSNCLERDGWVDQVVTGYVESWDTLGGDRHFAQNMRSQVGYDGTSTVLDSGTEIWTDFRLEQSAELSGAFTSNGSDPGDALTPGDNQDGIAGRQTFQQAIATESPGDFGFLLGGADTIGQMVSQDVQGYFMSCLNCDGPTAHAFQPAKQDLVFMPYDSGWSEVPTIAHGGR